jgi:hypothetical protein
LFLSFVTHTKFQSKTLMEREHMYNVDKDRRVMLKMELAEGG